MTTAASEPRVAEAKGPPAAGKGAGTKKPVLIGGVDFDDLDLVDVPEDGGDADPIPVVHGATVIYLGNRRNKAVSMQGRLFTEDLYAEEPEVRPCQACGGTKAVAGKECPECAGTGESEYHPKTGERKWATLEGGFQGYVFDTHDVHGRPVRSHRMPVTINNPEVAGRRFVICEHALHLWRFKNMKDANGEREFRLGIPKKARKLFDEFCWRADRAQGNLSRLIEQTVSSENQ